MFELLLAQAAVDTDRVLISGHITWIVGLALTALLTAATWALAELRKKLSVQTETTAKNMLLGQLAEFADVAVHEVGATMKTKYLEAAKDGKITAAEATELATAGVLRMKQLLTQDGVVRLQKAFGWGAAEVDAQIRGTLERKVVEAKVLESATNATTAIKALNPLKPL